MCSWKRTYLEQITGTNTAGMHGVEGSQNHRGRSSILTFSCGPDTSAKYIDIYIEILNNINKKVIYKRENIKKHNIVAKFNCSLIECLQ